MCLFACIALCICNISMYNTTSKPPTHHAYTRIFAAAQRCLVQEKKQNHLLNLRAYPHQFLNFTHFLCITLFLNALFDKLKKQWTYYVLYPQWAYLHVIYLGIKIVIKCIEWQYDNKQCFYVQIRKHIIMKYYGPGPENGKFLRRISAGWVRPLFFRKKSREFSAPHPRS